MEEDCEESSMVPLSKQNMADFSNLLSAFTQQMSAHVTKLQDQIRENDERTLQSQAVFRQEIRAELDALHAIVHNRSLSSPPPTPVVPLVVPVHPSSSTAPSSPDVPSSILDTSLSSQDLQHWMMLMLTESFSKLTTVLVENKTQDTKSDWPKFSGDAKKF
jgi:hypothetical protein